MSIKINVPGIGDISVEGVAEESTMREILSALKDKKGMKSKADADLEKAKRAEANQTKKLNNELDDVIDQFDEVQDSTEEVSKSLIQLKTGTTNLSKSLVNFGASLAATAAGIATSMATSYDQMAKDPISMGARLIDSAIDMVTEVTKIGIDVIGGVASGLAGMIPLVGGGLQKMGEAMTTFSKEVVDFSAGALKAANAVMAQEFQKTVDSMKQFTQAGASFAGGMSEMRDIANQSGLGLDAFTDIVAKSREHITNMGMSATEATRRLSKGLGALAADGGKLRGQLLSLGYSFEEQGELMALAMAGDRAAGDMRKKSDREMAIETARYAKDLKVLADITGKNAKAEDEKAQVASMQADIMAQLKPDEAKKFQAIFRSLPDVAKIGVKQLFASGGTAMTDVTQNIMASQNSAYNKLLQSAFTLTKDSSVSASEAGDRILELAAAAGAAQEEIVRTQGAPINAANTLVGALGDTAKGFNDLILQTRYGTDAVKNSRQTAEAQFNTQDEVTNSYKAATEATVAFQVQMQELAMKGLPMYSTMIADAVTKTTKIVDGTFKVMTQQWSAKKFFDEMSTRMSGDSNKSAGGSTKVTEKEVQDYQNSNWSWTWLSDEEAAQGATLQKWLAMNGYSGYEDPTFGEAFAFNSDGEKVPLSKMKGLPKDLGGSGYAKGGIASGSLSGYQATLHGSEAIVPLPDNRSIPVSLDSSSITESLERQTSILHKLVAAMEKGNRISSGIASNTA